MRRRSVLLAVPALMLSAAGCGGGEKKSGTTPTATSSGASSAPPAKVVSGPVPPITAGTQFGQKPTVAKGSVKPTTDLAVKTVIPGHGKTVAKGDYLEVNYLGQIWSTAKVFDNSYERGKPAVFQIGTGQVIPGWDTGLVGKKVGSRVELAIPPSMGYGRQGNPQAGIKGTDTLVFVVDVVNTFNGSSSAKGTVVPQTDAALPKVGTATDGKAPGITVPKKAAPTKLVAEYVIEGSGEPVKATDQVLVQYQGVVWGTGKQFASTYDNGQLAPISLGQVSFKALGQGLTGKKVGSRVLLVVPPALGYGKGGNPQEGVKGTDTVVFAVDILATL